MPRKEQYYKIKNDPEKWAKHKKYMNEYRKKRPYQKNSLPLPNDRRRIYDQKSRLRIKKMVQTWKKKKLVWFYDLIGGAYCRRCGYNKSTIALHFHHLNPEQKKGRDDKLSYWLKRLSIKQMKEKIKKTNFIILCANCHAEIHAEIWHISDLKDALM